MGLGSARRRSHLVASVDMTEVATARREALRLLGEARRRNAYVRELLRSSSRVDSLELRDRALVSRLVLGVTGARGLLDHTIDSHLRGRTHIEPRVRDALRLASFELLFLSTPAAVAVSQGVELVRSVRPRASSMANAVLRRVAEDDVAARSRAIERMDTQSVSDEDLALVSGYPAWLLRAVSEERGIGAACDLAKSACEAAPVYVAAVSSLHTLDETRDLLAAAGLGPVETEVDGAFRLAAPSGLLATTFVERGDIVVADLSAQRVAAFVWPRPGMRILEVGQGRGTKTILMQSVAVRAGGPASVVGVDAESHKTRISRQRMVRAGLEKHVSCITADGTRLGERDVAARLNGPFDAVLVDAPCSGTGTLRRHPEKAWGLSRDDVSLANEGSLPSLQLAMLQAAASAVAPGGTLAYSTCSVLRMENEGVVETFLAGDAGREFEPDGDWFVSNPRVGGPDGHFCARMRKVSR